MASALENNWVQLSVQSLESTNQYVKASALRLVGYEFLCPSLRPRVMELFLTMRKEQLPLSMSSLKENAGELCPAPETLHMVEFFLLHAFYPDELVRRYVSPSVPCREYHLIMNIL